MTDRMEPTKRPLSTSDKIAIVVLPPAFLTLGLIILAGYMKLMDMVLFGMWP